MSWQEPLPVHTYGEQISKCHALSMSVIKDCPSNNVECEVLPLVGDKGGSSAVLHLSD